MWPNEPMPEGFTAESLKSMSVAEYARRRDELLAWARQEKGGSPLANAPRSGEEINTIACMWCGAEKDPSVIEAHEAECGG